jgi:hypothetical protein
MISEIQNENIGNGIRRMPEFGLTGAIDSGGGCARNETRAGWMMLSSGERAKIGVCCDASRAKAGTQFRTLNKSSRRLSGCPASITKRNKSQRWACQHRKDSPNSSGRQR